MRQVAIYTRVSRRGEREEGRFHSHEEQEERARAHAESRGLTPGPVFRDEDVSGAVHPDERPAMSALLERLVAGELGGVVAYSLDRLSREPSHGDWLIREVTGAGGVVSTPDIPEDVTSPTGEFTFAMLLGVAKLYRRTAGARFASAKERAIHAGVPVGPTPFGYRQVVPPPPKGQHDTRTLGQRRVEPDPALVPVVRELFERRAAGEGYGALAAWLSGQTGRVWPTDSPRGVIRNRLYGTGRLHYGAVVSETDVGAIVDEPLWHAANAAQQQTLRPKRNPESPWLLTGLLRCASCGHALSKSTGGARRRRDPRRGKMEFVGRTPPRRYRCRNRDCTAKANVEAGQLERLAYLQSLAVGDELRTKDTVPTDTTALEEAVEAAARRLEQVDTPEAMDALGDRWAANVKERRREHEEALTRLGAARPVAVDAGQLNLRDVWDDLSPPDRRDTLALFWREIRVGPNVAGRREVTFVARGPGGEAEVELPGGDEDASSPH